MLGPDTRVSVIIPHFNDLAALRICIGHLDAQTFPRERFEVIVADNGSSASLAEIEAAAPGARVVRIAERGAGPARNGGVAASRHEIIAFTDSDCVPEPQWLEAGLRELASTDLVGGAVKVSVAEPGSPTPSEAFEVVFAFDNRSYVEKKGFSGSGNLFTTRAVFEDVGGFRPSVSEDVDWCHRARDKGYRLAFAPDAVVWHPGRRSWSELCRRWRRLTSEAVALERDKGTSSVRMALRAIAIALSPVAHVGRVLGHERLSPSGKLGALGVLFRLRLLRCLWLLSDLMKPAEPQPAK